LKKVELLAPAKNLKAIKAGVKYADSFYFGAKSLNMRMQADNFTEKDLPNAVKFCHDNNKKAYLTTNILIYETELDSLKQLLEFALGIEFDAVIVHDLSAIEFCKEIGMPFHISTQANISNSVSARFYENLGAERLILARECSLEQIREIRSKLNKAEIEIFIHGAMCTSVSGRCYFSMDVCGTEEYSANRGRCVQPCRRQWRVIDDKDNEYIYDGERFINSRDLCMIEYIPDLIESADALKIEGRMREPHYVDVVTKTYREAINGYYDGTFTKKKVGKWIFELKKVYNRGFTNGFYFNRPTEKDHQHKSPTNLSHWRLIKVATIKSYSKKEKKAKVKVINGSLDKGMSIIVQGDAGSTTYFHQKLYKIEMNGKFVNSTGKVSGNQYKEARIKVKSPVASNGKDHIYVFTDKTYRHRKSGKNLKKNEYYRL
jgi:putative protease